jgi:hypothetical protein
MKKKQMALAIAALGFAWPAFAQPASPVYDKPAFEEPQEYRDRSADFHEAYRRGYEAGFERGYSKGMADGERRASMAPPAPTAIIAAPPPRIGPIRVTGAYYGTSSKNCEATRWMSGRANGKRSYSVDVTNDICGDPAKGQRKSLEVTYRCGDIQKSASANEHRTIYLDCSS